MPRIRTIKPEFLRHEKLQDLEMSDPAAHVMLVFQGLWVVSDREGRFEWRPRTLHLDILPFIPFDMAKTMELLEVNGYINRYEANGATYGQVVSWHRHQLVGRDEPPSEIPAPDGLLNAYHRPPNSTVRARIYQRDDYKCVYCGRSLQKDMRAICLDHVIPYDKRGSNTENNLATSCKPCNAKKSNRTPADAGMKWPDLLGEFYDGSLTVRHHPVNTPSHVPSQPSDKGGEVERELEVEVELGGDTATPLPVSGQIVTPLDSQPPLNCARVVVEMLSLPLTNKTLRDIEAAIVAEAKMTGQTFAQAGESLAQYADRDRIAGTAINTFYWQDTKWRDYGKANSAAQQRSHRTKATLVNVLRKHVSERVALDDTEQQNGTGTGSGGRVPAGLRKN